MSTFIIPETAAPRPTDWDELVLAYIYDKWTETDPAKPATIDVNENRFRFKVGFYTFTIPYELAILETETMPLNAKNGGRIIQYTTTFDIGLRMKRLNRASTQIDPQLGRMQNEMIKIVGQYRPQDIPGVKAMIYDGGGRVYDAADTWAKSDWRAVVRYKILYEIRDIS